MSAISIVHNRSTHENTTYPKRTQPDHPPSRNKKSQILCHCSRRASAGRCHGCSGTCCGCRLAWTNPASMATGTTNDNWNVRSPPVNAGDTATFNTSTHNFVVSFAAVTIDSMTFNSGARRFHDRHKFEILFLCRCRHQSTRIDNNRGTVATQTDSPTATAASPTS